MCGISGELRFDGSEPSLEVQGGMMRSLAPRGPDASGLHQQGHVALAHRRLKVVDLTERAQQPMVDAELGLVLVFNGMIYNYRELREELRGLGYRFFSEGDTEVVLKAYDAWGDSCVDRLDGMFAFAVWARDTGRLFLARDRLGIKPLYHAAVPGGFRFASTLPALLQGPGVDTRIDPAGLHHYLSFHAVVPAPGTILRGCRKLPPGCTLSVAPDGRTDVERYWRLEFGQNGRHPSPEEWEEGLLEALQRAVRRRTLADVPVGVLLSGGLDSSLVVALLASRTSDLHTFSIGFESLRGEAGDEFAYSDLVAQTFGTRHHRIEAGADRTLDSIEACVRSMSEPMVSHDCVGFYLLSQEVSKHVKVVQSGQGADEVFAGYHWYPRMGNGRSPVDDYARAFFDRSHAELAELVHPRFVQDDHSRRFVEQHFAAPGADSPVDKALRIDTTVMLPEDPVKRVDNMTMAWGLEARVPFLDHELVEFAARIPPELKLAQGGKGILKRIGAEVLPNEVVDRPKGYFPVPALKYLRGSFLESARDVLTGQRARERELFDPEYVERLLREPEGQITPLGGSKLWQLALLELWLQANDL